MAFKMNRPSMIDISYNKEKNSVSPLHKETDPLIDRLKDKYPEGKESIGPEEEPKTKQAMSAVKKKIKPKVKTVNEIKSKDVATTSSEKNFTPSSKPSKPLKPSKPTPPKDTPPTPPKDTQKSKPSGADALKAAKEARRYKNKDKKKDKKAKRRSEKDTRQQNRADKIMSKL